LPVGSALIGLLVLVGGIVGRVVALGATVAVGVGVALGEGLALGDALGEAETLGEGLAAAADEQLDEEIVSLIRVTSPLRASARPLSVTPVCIVMEVRAMIVPTKVEPDPSVAELVTCQKTLHALAPLMSFTALFEAVMSDDVALKIQTDVASF
jgi:hypothetical protein